MLYLRGFPKRKGKAILRQSQRLVVFPTDLTTTGNVSLTSVQDGPMVVQHYNNLTVAAGHTLTVTNRCKGLLLVVHGNLTVSGTITMLSRGAAAVAVEENISRKLDNAVEIRWPTNLEEINTWLRKNYYRGMDVEAALLAADLWPTIDDLSPFITVGCIIPAVGGSGGAGAVNGGAAYRTGSTGAAGTNRQTGGGGGGASYNAVGGQGAPGTGYSGGPGGGAGYNANGANGADNGDKGGDGKGNYACGGGGNPGGAGTGGRANGVAGTGGLLIIICLGNILINAGGSIHANAPSNSPVSGPAGGGAGGGSVNIFHKGTYINGGTVSANGGPANHIHGSGGTGGAGCVTVTQL